MNPRTVGFAKGSILVGGSPTRLLKLGARARDLLGGGSLVVVDEATGRLVDRLLSLGVSDLEVSSLPLVSLDQLTVVVPVYQRADQLDRLLAGLRDVQVIVVDDASPNAGEIETVAAQHGARLIRLQINSGPGAARNRGLSEVTSPFVAFCDSDTVVAPPTLAHMLRQFRDARVGLVAPRVRALSSVDDRGWVSQYEAARSSLDLGPDSAVVRPYSLVAWVPSACVVARVQSLGAGFDRSLRAGEDVDLVWRLVGEGWLVRYDASLSVAHEHRDTPRKWLVRKFFYGTSAAPLARRHGPAVAPAVLTPTSALALVGLVLQRRWSAAWTVAGLAVQTVSVCRKVKEIDAPTEVSSYLVRRGTLDTVTQGSGLLLRHWFPAMLLSLIVSGRARRAVALAIAVDAIAQWPTKPGGMSFSRFVVARRLDDAAYGLGVWFGAIRARSARCLLPSIRRTASAGEPSKGSPAEG